MQLVGRDALLAGRHQVVRQDPLGQRDMTALHDLSGADRELAAAVGAMEQAGATDFAAHAT